MSNRRSVKPLKNNERAVSYARTKDSFSGDADWQARIMHGGQVEWQCSHRHPGQKFAIKCGNARFLSLDGAGRVVEEPTPEKGDA